MDTSRKYNYVKYRYHIYDKNDKFLVTCYGRDILLEILGITDRVLQDKYGKKFSDINKLEYGRFRVYPELNGRMY